jgi:hypothetical protein
MASNFTSHRFWEPAWCYQYPILACDSFQLVLLLIAFTIMIRTLVGFVVIILFVLIVARILCIYCGKYYYNLPKGKQI